MSRALLLCGLAVDVLSSVLTSSIQIGSVVGAALLATLCSLPKAFRLAESVFTQLTEPEETSL